MSDEGTVAAIDCGTNSIRLLIARLDPAAGGLVELDRRMLIVRLGQGVDRTGAFAPEALERTFAACREYRAVIERHGASRIRFVATSATRDAANRDQFAAGVRDLFGVGPEVISGDEEAALSFAGATRELAALTEASRPYLVLDIGGGSTEFVLGGRAAEVAAARSVDIGCVRMTERHLHGDPPTAEQIAAARADIDAAIEEAGRTVPVERAGTLVGLAGSVTTVAALAMGLAEYDSDQVHHAWLTADQVRDVTHRLLAASHAQRAANPVIHPGRVDVIGAGALILTAVMERVGAQQVLVSEHDILDGIAWSLF